MTPGATKSTIQATIAGILVVLASVLQWLFTLAEDKVEAATADRPATLCWQVLDWAHVVPAVVVAMVGVVLLVGSQVSARREVKKLVEAEEERQKREIEAFLRYLHRRLFKDDQNSRISLFRPTEDERWLEQVYRTVGTVSSKKWSLEKGDDAPPRGIAGETYVSRLVLVIDDLPDVEDWDGADEEERQGFCAQSFTPIDVAPQLSWRARSYRSLFVPGPDQEPVAVLMFESKDPKGLVTKRIGNLEEGLREDGIYLAQLLYSRWEER